MFNLAFQIVSFEEIHTSVYSLPKEICAVFIIPFTDLSK
jgi:hypothetical protein